ncbi:MAG: hypothetical protein GY820_43360, partial [Gammaproteobacteria bacterium]|nr:hypothetical protein [Gammaproteobacteria bacterium]
PISYPQGGAHFSPASQQGGSRALPSQEQLYKQRPKAPAKPTPAPVHRGDQSAQSHQPDTAHGSTRYPMHRSKSRGPQPTSHKTDYGEYRPPMQAGQGNIRQVVVEDPKTTYWKQRALLAEGAQAQRASGHQNVQGEREGVSSQEHEPPQQGGPLGGGQGYETQQGSPVRQGRRRSRSSVSACSGAGL